MGTISSGLLQAGVIKKSKLTGFFCNSLPWPLTRHRRPLLSMERSGLSADDLVLCRCWDLSSEISTCSRPITTCPDANLCVPAPQSFPCLTYPYMEFFNLPEKFLHLTMAFSLKVPLIKYRQMYIGEGPFAGGGWLRSSNRCLLLMAAVVYLSLPVDGVRTTLVTQTELPLASKEDACAGLILLFSS